MQLFRTLKSRKSFAQVGLCLLLGSAFTLPAQADSKDSKTDLGVSATAIEKELSLACQSGPPSEARATVAENAAKKADQRIALIKTRLQAISQFLDRPLDQLIKSNEEKLKRLQLELREARLKYPLPVDPKTRATSGEIQNEKQAQIKSILDEIRDTRQALTDLQALKQTQDAGKNSPFLQATLKSAETDLNEYTELSNRFQELRERSRACYAQANNTGKLARFLSSSPEGGAEGTAGPGAGGAPLGVSGEQPTNSPSR